MAVAAKRRAPARKAAKKRAPAKKAVKRAPAKRAVKRAEEFMRANASSPLTIEAIANAAGCSVRALQLAFRRFRSTTPMAELQHLRLEAARTEMMRANRAHSPARIAAEHGFSNASRFARLFRRTYGAYPSQALRARRGLLIAFIKFCISRRKCLP